MKRKKSLVKIIGLLMTLALCFCAAVPVPASASAASDAGYDCVAYAKARFREVWGFDLHPTGIYNGRYGAQGYYYNAAANGDTVTNTPAAGCLAVWGDSTYGHVGFVEQVNGDQILLTEGGFNGRYHEGWYNRYSLDRSWTSGGQNYYQKFLGFVYIKGTNPGGGGQEEPDPIPPSEELGTNFYGAIVNVGAGKCLTSSARYDGGNNVFSRVYQKGAYQIWKFERQENGSYKIISAFDGRCLDIADASSASGANVQVVGDNGNAAQRWYIYKTSHSYNGQDAYTFRGGCTECVLDVADGSGADGANIQVWTANQTPAQQFTIQRIDGSWSVPGLYANASGGGNYQFVWNDVEGVSHTDIKIWKGASASGEPMVSATVVGSRVYNTTLEPGTYTAQIEMYNAFWRGTGTPITFTVEAAVLKGDVDDNGTVNIQDVMAACRILARQNTGSAPDPDELLRGDMNEDGKFLIDDIMGICRVLARKN